MKIDVVVPTYRRVDDLTRCLTALMAQERRPDGVIVTVRDIDTETQDFLADFDKSTLPVAWVIVSEPGVVAAMSAGVAAADADIIALIDDDTAPFPDWLSRIETCFLSDPKIGGVGGRDWQPYERGDAAVIGKLQWFGRVIGNHHLGAGPARDVDILKGANCAYRAEPLKKAGFDPRLYGKGAQVHWEIGLNLTLRRAGWRLVYDPAIAVDHYVGQRFDNDLVHRGIYAFEGHYNAVHNETVLLLDHFPPAQRAVYLFWAFTVGTRGDPGLLQIPRLLARKDRYALPKFRSTQLGRLAGWRTWRATRGAK